MHCCAWERSLSAPQNVRTNKRDCYGLVEQICEYLDQIVDAVEQNIPTVAGDAFSRHLQTFQR